MPFGFDMGKTMQSIASNLTSNKLSGKTKFNTAGLDTIKNTLSGKTKAKYKSYIFKYNIVTFQLLIPGEEPFNILTQAVNQIIVTKEYDLAIHPILEIITMLPPMVHKKMVDNKSNLNVRLRIQKDRSTKDGDKMRSTDWINDTFQVIIDDDSDFQDEENYKRLDKEQGGDGTGRNKNGSFNINDYTTEYTISLWKQSDIEAIRKVVNCVKANATISTVIADIYGKSGIKKILISPLDNSNSYPEIRIPPMNLLNLPEYLEKIYGTYYSGTTVFLDFRCLYFLSRNGVCDAKEKGEYTRTVFKIVKQNGSASLATTSGTMEDPDNKIYYMNIEPTSIEFNSPGASSDAISGNNVSVISTANNETVAIDGVGTQRGNGNSRVSNDKYNNEFNKASMLSKVVEDSCRCTVSLTDYDVDAITPNKEFIVSADDPKLEKRNGFYRLTESRIVLTKNDSNLSVAGTHYLSFKASIGTQADKEEKTPTATKVKTDNMKSEAQKEEDAKKTGTTGPQAALGGDNMTTSNSVEKPADNKVAQNNNYSYDSLGNVQGVDIPEYNKITPDDDGTVIEAKKKAQQKSLPCAGPGAKLG